MKHSFNLVRPKAQTSSIRLVVSHAGEKTQRCTGLVIRTSLWNQKGRTPDKQCKDKDIWAKLSPIHTKLLEREVSARNKKAVADAIAYAFGEGKESASGTSLWDYFYEWSERDTASKRFRQLAYSRLSDMMGREDDWGDIDGDWYFRFTQKADALKYSHNYKSTLLAKFKAMMNEAYGRGIHSNENFRLFPTSYKTADTIALTQTEVDAIWSAELTGVKARARDCFIIGVYCAGRFQDYSRLTSENITEDGKLRYVQKKTGQTVIIPCSPRIREVFERNGGGAPKISEQEVGREIKKICKDLGGSFLDMVEVRRDEGNKMVVKQKARWELCSTHTARRSSISILHRSGVPLFQLMAVSGHHTIQNLQKYLKADKTSDYELLAKIEFFK